MARNLWSDRPLGVKLQSAAHIAENIDAVATGTAATTSAMNDAQVAIDEVARMATSLQSSVARFRY
jgi:methyl-accepting chemotaxis protein